MPLTMKTGATGLTVVAGTDKVFSADGQSVSNGVHMADMAQLDFRTRDHVTIKNRNPVRQTDGSYSKGKREIILTRPFMNAAGKVVYNTYRFIQEVDPEYAAASEKDGRYLLCQFMSDSETELFNSTGAIPQ